MSTAEETGRYVITSDADSILGRLESDFGDVLVNVASRMTSAQTNDHVPIVDVGSISSAAQLLCSAVQDAIKVGEAPPDAVLILEALRDFCKTATAEREDGGEDLAPTH